MGFDQPWHWLVVIALAAVLFGYKRLPEASRSLGRSLRIFKTEIKGMGEDDKAREAAATPVVPPQAELTAPTEAAQPVAPASAPVNAPVSAPVNAPAQTSTPAE